VITNDFQVQQEDQVRLKIINQTPHAVVERTAKSVKAFWTNTYQSQ
jgi:hypothetical protein